MEDLLAGEQVQLTSLKRGIVVTAKILKIDRHEILADIGAKSFGIIVGREFDAIAHMADTLTVGQILRAEVIIPEMEDGTTLISLRKTLINSLWDELARVRDGKKEVNVSGLRAVSSGLLVDCSSLRGFIPQQQLDPSHQENPDRLVGKTFPVQVLEVDQKQNRLVLSQKEVTQKEGLATKRAAVSSYTVGDTVKGTVATVDRYTIVVSVKRQVSGVRKKETRDQKPEVTGTVHISEVKWERVDDLAALYKEGDSISGQVIGIDTQEGVLNLSIKQLAPDPWKDIEKKYPKESQVRGTVAKVTNLGAFVELEKGIEGLIHVSKIPAGHEFAEGEKIAVVVDSLDTQNRKMSLAYVPTTKPIGYR